MSVNSDVGLVDSASDDWRAEAAEDEAVEDLLDLVLARIAFVLIESDTSLSIRTSRLNCSSQSLQLEAFL